MLTATSLAALPSCSVMDMFRSEPMSERRVTMIEIDKSRRKMHLYKGQRHLKSYRIALGREPRGHKRQEGDGRTPNGTYVIDRRNPDSLFFLSLGISYPNRADRARAARAGVSPGGDIFIHGQPNDRRRVSGDWTEGCIAVSNRDMREIYRWVGIGTRIRIRE